MFCFGVFEVAWGRAGALAWSQYWPRNIQSQLEQIYCYYKEIVRSRSWEFIRWIKAGWDVCMSVVGSPRKLKLRRFTCRWFIRDCSWEWHLERGRELRWSRERSWTVIQLQPSRWDTVKMGWIFRGFPGRGLVSPIF